MVISGHSKEEIFDYLSLIPDPEIPAVSIRDIGMLRDVRITLDGYEVIITPTYTGCPAMGIIEEDIKTTLEKRGVFPVIVKLVYSPAWTTDWMSEEAKEKMRKFGITPPLHSSCNSMFMAKNTILCPICNSSDTELISQFGSTACKALYKCNNCLKKDNEV